MHFTNPFIKCELNQIILSSIILPLFGMRSKDDGWEKNATWIFSALPLNGIRSMGIMQILKICISVLVLQGTCYLNIVAYVLLFEIEVRYIA